MHRAFIKAIVAIQIGLVILTLAYAANAQEVHGFVEGLVGGRSAEGSGFDAGSYTVEETRFQLRVSDYGDDAEYFTRLDFSLDQITEEEDLEIREAYLKYNGWSSVDIKFGRQIITWGTGDLLFVNDVFAKDWESLFVGREDQYLKAPHDALRLGFYPAGYNIDLVLMPEFEADRLPTPGRLAFHDPLMGASRTLMEPDNEVGETEIALRISRSVAGFDLALYGYRGFFRQPLGVAPASGTPGDPTGLYFPRLNVYGLSVRGNRLGGVVNLEGGYYHSRDDENGADPLVENGSVRWMAGYDRQLAADTQLGLQGYYELMLHHACYQRNVAPGMPTRDELRQMYTLRLTQMFQYQTLIASLFTFWSPTDEDHYVRASISKKLTDQLEATLGAGIFGGSEDHTLFGQFEYNDNVYLRARYSF